MTRGAFLIALALLGAGVEKDPPTRLEAGSSQEREIGVGETHLYEIDLDAGEYLYVLVEQQSADVAQKLTGPDGSVLLETDSPCGPVGPDPLALVATATGVHRLALEAGEVAVPPRGRYVIRVEALREPTPSDRLRARAVRANADALSASSTDRRAELDHYLGALDAWQALGDRRMEMWTRLVVGFSRAFDLDDPQGAEEPYERALATAVELHDEWAEARVSDDLAQVEIRLGRLERTRELMERALALQRSAGRPAYVSRMLTVLGSFYSLVGEPQSALDRLYDALEINQRLGRSTEVARTRIEIGATYLRLGDPELAQDQYQQALPGLDDPGRRARCITEMGVAALKLGDHEGARRRYQEAFDIYRTLENRIAEADTLIGLGDLDRDQGNLEAAMRSYTAALTTFTAKAYPLGIGMAQCRRGEMERRLGDAEAARRAFLAVLDAGPAVGGTASMCAEQGLARLDAREGALDSARRHAEAAMSLLEAQRSLASPRAREAALAARQSVFGILTDVHMRAHLRDPAAGHDAAAFEVSERARARSLLDLLAEGRVDVSQGVRPELLAEERSLRQRLNATATAQAAARAAGRTARAEGLDRELDRLSVQLADAQSHIRTASPHYAALTQARPLTLAEVRSRVLDPDTQILEYELGDEQAYAWVVSADGLESARLAAPAEIESAALRLHELLSKAPRGGADAERLGAAQEELSRLVLAPVAPRLTAGRLLVIAPGALQYVPFASLTLPGGARMLSRFEVVSAPSASIIATLRDEAAQRVPARKSVAVFADPVFERGDPRLARAASSRGAAAAVPGFREGLGRLPFSRGEADSIASLTTSGDSLQATGFAASRPAAMSQRLADYRIVHFATHAILNTRRPELSGVVLSLFDADGAPRDGFLRLHDVYNLRLRADLVVLSGCQTALGRDLKGEGLIGLTRGFMYAGARAVVASLWQVDDASTAELMKRFYRSMLKDRRRPAAALRSAQLEMARDAGAAPFYWAGFVLQGDWR